jgi:hypothetical protein
VASGSDLENKARFGEILEVEGAVHSSKIGREKTLIGLRMDWPSEEGSEHQRSSVSDDHRSSL